MDGKRGMLQKADSSTHGEKTFKFWDQSFDGLNFIYDHLNTAEDIEKVKTINAKKCFNSYVPI